MSLRKIELINGKCPEGYEYVRGHIEHSGIRVREFCRKIPEKRIKMVMDMRYPGNTKIKISGGQGMKNHISETTTIPTEKFFSGDKEFRNLLDMDWKNPDEKMIKQLGNKRGRK